MSRRLLIAVSLFVLVAGFYWKLTLTSQYNWMWSPDLAGQVLPWFEVQAREWHRHQFPMWDQHLWGGQPLFGQAQPGAAYPLNWLLFLLPLDADHHIQRIALDWYFVIIHLMAAAFCYRLCRELERSRTASVCGAAVFALAGYVGSTDWPQMINGAVWIPLIFLFLIRAGAGKRLFANSAGAGAALGMAWLSGHHQVPMMISLACAGTWIYFALRENGPPDWRMVKAAALCFTLSGICGALQILPAWEYGHLANRWVGSADSVTWKDVVPYYVHERYSLPPYALLGTVFPDWHTGIDPFVGLVALTLAGLAIATAWKDWRVRLMGAIGLGGLMYAMGGLSLPQGLLYGLAPSLDKARTPAVASAFFGFALAVLCAFGFDRWRSDPGARSVRRAATAAFCFFALIVAACTVAPIVSGQPIDWGSRAMAVAMVAGLWALLLNGTARVNVTLRVAAVLAVALLVYELYQGTGYSFAPYENVERIKFANQITGNRDIGDYLRGQPGMQRTIVEGTVSSSNWGEYHDVPMWGGYLASITSNVLSFENFSPAAMKLWGVMYLISAKGSGYATDEIFTGASGLKVFRQPGAFPRVWAVHKLVQVKDMDAGNQMILQHLDDLKSEAFLLEHPPQLAPCADPQDGIHLTEEAGSRVGILVSLNCPAMLVLSSTYFPGWHANVDRKPAAIFQVDGAMRGVLVPAGQHTITMRYRPDSVYAGLGLSVLGFLAAALIIRLNRV